MRAGAASTQADADGAFVIGPLPPGRIVLQFTAPGHHPEAQAVEVPADGQVALPAPIVLYRGQRLTTDHPDRLRFRFDEAWLAWDGGDVLSASPLPDPAPRVLVPRDYEVFLGWSLQAEAVHVRRRTVPGLAGDLDRVALDPVGRTPLFVEAQPWIIEVGDRAVSMVHTRDALSRLESVVPGQAPTVLAEGVPWLLVQRMADDRLAWAAGDADGFDVFVGPTDGGPAEQVNAPGAPASDALLTTTPGRRGLLWLGVDGALWRYEPERGAERLAEDVLAAPRPGFLPDGRVTFWRADVDGTQALHVYDDAEGEWRLVGQADGFSFRAVGDVYYLARPDRSLWRGDFDGGGEDVLLGAPGGFVVLGDAVLALIDGAAWRYRPQLGAEALNVEGLSGLRNASGGAVAWEEGELGDRLWYLPLLGDQEATPLLDAAANRAIVSEPGGGALYVRDADSAWRRLAVPPDGGEDVAFAAGVEQLFTVSAEQVLGLDAEGGLFTIDPRTGAARAWAFNVDVVQPSGRGSYVAYVCDRGLFLVDQR
ncbi:MAG: carboxypeptidase regulatory-like domain-containing protein [Myxococcales bacterium]|nr:carboxypeptidase regulatory-like domain-containing protein [Myxococcales bacterium]